MHSEAETVSEYLASLPDDRRKAIEALRRVIRKHVPKGYEEGISFGMITYSVPEKRFPGKTYNGQPLQYAALASQKNYMSLYLNNVYADHALRERFEEGFRDAGKRLDMGKSCVRFKRIEDLPLDAIGEAIAATSVDEWVEIYEAARPAPAAKASAKRSAATKPAARKR